MTQSVKFLYVLFYSNRTKRYKIAKVKKDNFNPKNPNVLWIFRPEKLETAKRVLKNMNLALTTSEYPELKVA